MLPGSLRGALGALPGRLRAEGGGAFGSTEIGVSASQRVQDRERTEDRQRRGKGQTEEETKHKQPNNTVFIGICERPKKRRERKSLNESPLGRSWDSWGAFGRKGADHLDRQE